MEVIEQIAELICYTKQCSGIRAAMRWLSLGGEAEDILSWV